MQIRKFILPFLVYALVCTSTACAKGQKVEPGFEVTIASSNGTPITATTNTELIAPPGAGKAIRIYYITLSNSVATDSIVGVRQGENTSTTDPIVYENELTHYQPFPHTIAGGNGYWQLDENNGLYLKQSAAGTIYYTIEYKEVNL